MREKGERRVLLGVLVIAVGVVLLMRNFGIIQADIGRLIATYWPVVLVVWGIDILLTGTVRRDGRAFGLNFTGFILVIAGLFILVDTTGLFDINFQIFWKIFWPAILILVGWSLLRRSAAPGGTHWAVMSGIDLKNQGWKLEDGNYIALMGGMKLDLTVADIPDITVHLDLTAVMGGIEVICPPDLSLEGEGTAVLGGIKMLHDEGGGIAVRKRFQYTGEPGSPRKLVITGLAIMGGIEIKH